MVAADGGRSLTKGIGSLGLSRESCQTPCCLFVEAGGGGPLRAEIFISFKTRGHHFVPSEGQIPYNTGDKLWEGPVSSH